MQAELIYNPSSGQVVVRHELDNVVAFLNRYGWSVTLRETSKPLEATELARYAANRDAKVVIAAGGDGTVNEVANGLVNTVVALGVLPVGTTNSWALQMGIPALNPMLPGTQADTSGQDDCGSGGKNCTSITCQLLSKGAVERRSSARRRTHRYR